MGFSLCWLAVRGKVPEQILADLDATPTGEVVEFGESRFAARRLVSGWYAVYAKAADHAWLHPDWLSALSGGAELIACRIEEHTMHASAQGWQGGELRWRVEHDAQQGSGHLLADGTLPEAYAAVAAEMRLLQARSPGVDYLFELPLKLAQRLTGFKHDEGDAGGERRWQALQHGPKIEPARDEKKPWWQLW
jgi:hypothetical protein